MYIHYFHEYLRGLSDRTNVVCNIRDCILNTFSTLSKHNNWFSNDGFSNDS